MYIRNGKKPCTDIKFLLVKESVKEEVDCRRKTEETIRELLTYPDCLEHSKFSINICPMNE